MLLSHETYGHVCVCRSSHVDAIPCVECYYKTTVRNLSSEMEWRPHYSANYGVAWMRIMRIPEQSCFNKATVITASTTVICRKRGTCHSSLARATDCKVKVPSKKPKSAEVSRRPAGGRAAGGGAGACAGQEIGGMTAESTVGGG